MKMIDFETVSHPYYLYIFNIIGILFWILVFGPDAYRGTIGGIQRQTPAGEVPEVAEEAPEAAEEIPEAAEETPEAVEETPEAVEEVPEVVEEAQEAADEVQEVAEEVQEVAKEEAPAAEEDDQDLFASDDEGEWSIF